jgi:adenylate cyclase
MQQALPIRQLAAIMFTDIVGYTTLMGNDEQQAFTILNKNRALQKPIIEQYNGRWIKELGDGILSSFNAVSDAVNAAIKIQETCASAKGFLLRIGIHLGEVIFENDDVFGDGVNIASRIQAIARPGGIYISESVYHNIYNKQDIVTRFVKQQTLKNVKEPIKIYEVITAAGTLQLTAKEQNKLSPKKSIAVLPFVNMSNDPQQEYFSEGMSEEILNSLALLKDLKVAGRTSSFQFKGKNIDVREVGHTLGVTSILEGSVRKQGNHLRITAQLINVEDGFHIWSERYDREMNDVFAIQDEIALAITEKLKVTLLENDRELIKKIPTHNTEAYQFYLQGRYFWKKRNEEGLKNAAKFFEKALEKDPDYALAWAGLADTYSLMGEYTNTSRRTLLPQQMNAINRALQIDPGLGEAHISLATSLMLNEWDWVKSEREFRIGIELTPNYATGHHWFAEWLLYNGNFSDAFSEISLAVELDPVSQGILKDKGIHFYYTREYDEAIDMAMKTLELDPDFVPVYRLLSLAYLGKGMFEQAIVENELWGKLTGNRAKTDVALAQIYATWGKKEDARKIIEDVGIEKILSGNDYRGMALVYAALGEDNKAFEWLEKSYERHEESLCSLKVDPKFDDLRLDPRFEKFLKIGL